MVFKDGSSAVKLFPWNSCKLKINDNMLQLPNNWNVSNTFNLADLFEYHPYDEELHEPNLKTSFCF